MDVAAGETICCVANENKYKTANFELGLASSRLWVKFKNIFDCTIMIK